MKAQVPKPQSRKVSGYIKTRMALQKIEEKRQKRYVKLICPLDLKRNKLATEALLRSNALNGWQRVEAARLLEPLGLSMAL